jgi:hypothetical protein
VANKIFDSTAPKTQTSYVQSLQLRNPKDNQKTEGKRKSKGNKGKGDKMVGNNVGEGKKKIGG